MSTEKVSEKAPQENLSEIKKPFNAAEFIFKNLSIVINIIIALCIPGFIKFRTYC